MKWKWEIKSKRKIVRREKIVPQNNSTKNNF
jgi:hypothetical protein